MKKIGLILLGLYYLSPPAFPEAFRPYQPGSVYNLNNYLPWADAGPDIVSYPTGCSVNRLADFAVQLFFPQSKGPFTEIFHSECVRHDLCYRHGSYTYEFTKNYCDDEFAQGLEYRCKMEFRGQEGAQCQRIANVLILGARKFGHLSYHADDYPFRDYGYYYEYMDNRAGQYALLWSLLDPTSERYRALYRHKVNSDLPLPSGQLTRRFLQEFFRKQIGLIILMNRLKIFPVK